MDCFDFQQPGYVSMYDMIKSKSKTSKGGDEEDEEEEEEGDDNEEKGSDEDGDDDNRYCHKLLN